MKLAKSLKALCVLLYSLSLCFTTAARSLTQECPTASRPVAHLQTGMRARVIPGHVVNLRLQPGLNSGVIDQVPAGSVLGVLDGPRCADHYLWWQVSFGERTGWMAEGNPRQSEYWLEPLAVPLSAALFDSSAIGVAQCLEPPDDYTRVRIGAAELNRRTLAMLDYAQSLYESLGGLQVNFRQAITQGSYTGGFEAASFGTHDGGGAVDLSVRSTADFSVLTDDIPLMLRALRVAGFAAWLREPNELGQGSPIHIHAVAVGDRQLSQAARDQIDGPYGYLHGYDGLPREDGVPRLDRSGETVLCPWMIETGSGDRDAP